jgi:hypothetical protein
MWLMGAIKLTDCWFASLLAWLLACLFAFQCINIISWQPSLVSSWAAIACFKLGWPSLVSSWAGPIYPGNGVG